MLIWLVYDHRHEELRAWSSPIEKVAANQKMPQALLRALFDDLLTGFKPMAGLTEIQAVVTKFRNALWPQNEKLPEIERDNLDRYKDRFYDRIDEAFKEGIWALEDTQVTGRP